MLPFNALTARDEVLRIRFKAASASLEAAGTKEKSPLPGGCGFNTAESTWKKSSQPTNSRIEMDQGRRYRSSDDFVGFVGFDSTVSSGYRPQ